MRESAEDCCSCRSWLRPVSYNRRVLVKFRSSAGVELADVGAVDGQSLNDGVSCCDVTEVAAVEFRVMEGTDDVVDDVSRFRLYAPGAGDSDRASTSSVDGRLETSSLSESNDLRSFSAFFHL